MHTFSINKLQNDIDFDISTSELNFDGPGIELCNDVVSKIPQEKTKEE